VLRAGSLYGAGSGSCVSGSRERPGDPSAQISDLRPVRMVIKGGRKVVENGVVLE
jgi:hypothetical protein